MVEVDSKYAHMYSLLNFTVMSSTSISTTNSLRWEKKCFTIGEIFKIDLTEILLVHSGWEPRMLLEAKCLPSMKTSSKHAKVLVIVQIEAMERQKGP